MARAPYHRISWFTTLEDRHKIHFLQVLNLLMKGNTGCQTCYVQKHPLLSSRSLIRQFEKPHSKELQQWLSFFTHVVVSGRSSTGWEDDSYKVHLLATQLVISKHSRLLTSSANTLSAWQGVNFKWTSQSGGRSSVHHRCSLSTDPKFHSWQDLQEGLDDPLNRSPNCTAILTLSCASSVWLNCGV